ncbi:recombination protein Rad52, partial [Meredithblackwellia eburnea MCA 4105]
SEEEEAEHERIKQLLKKKLGPEYLSQRQGGGGTKLTYIEGWRVINLANEIFGFNGWYTEIKTLEIDFIDQNPETGRFNIGCTAIVRVWLKHGGSHEDVGYGKLENSKSKADALDKCKKEAVTDALKRTLRNFGSVLGNCLYDKHYTAEVSKMKAPKVSRPASS